MENKDRRIDITSTALEKGIDMAKNFLDKLIMPAAEEVGLLMRDQVTLWKFKNQVNMLNKAKACCEKNNILPKTISLKLLCPLLDYSGIEEDETLQDKWAILLSNMVDSEQNIENHVFPYILSQLSSNEFLVLEQLFDEKKVRVTRLRIELAKFREEKPQKEAQLKTAIDELEVKILAAKQPNKKRDPIELTIMPSLWELYKEKRVHESEMSSLKVKEWSLLHDIAKLEQLPYDCLKEFELSNLIRLGLIKEIKTFYANSQTLEIPTDPERYGSYVNVDLDIDVESDLENVLTELGELFISACKEKTKK